MKAAIFFIFMTILVTQLQAKTLLILGDSLTEGIGVAKDQAYPALLEKKIRTSGKNWKVINAGISGATSASGISRMKWHMKQKPDLVILALGANDGLRGFAISETEKNLSTVIEMGQKEKIQMVLAGMLMPPNYGKEYSEKFKNLFPKLAKKYKVRLIPFLLDQVASDPSLNQADGIHPNEKGHQVVAETVYKNIQDLL
ncbi:MAG: arylesterase [Oligoflexia bacterium]|nr:MAG: arylesterase [Oligoflexia bacterium]